MISKVAGIRVGEVETGLVGEWWVHSLKKLIKKIGKEEAKKSIQLYLTEHDVCEWLDAKKEARSGKSALHSFGSILKLGLFMAGIPNKVEIFRGGVVATMFNCPFVHGCPGVCEIHRMLSSAVLNTIDPQYSHKFVCMHGQGNSTCKYIFSGNDLDSCSGLVEVIAEPDIPQDELNNLSNQYLSQLWLLLVNAFVDAAWREKSLCWGAIAFPPYPNNLLREP